jgi:L-ascorbate metabolism protein UlaG (beta-lactamase superfamily)
LLKKLCVSALLLIVVACANNTVTVQSSTKGQEAPVQEGRYSNRYPGEKSYPYSCTSDCYPITEDIECEQPMQNCQYKGKNPTITSQNGFSVKWLGHASFAIKTPSGKQLLFDPVLGQFDWPVDWAFQLSGGFKRKEPTSLDLNSAKVDAVMYSHLHYDHFSKRDITKLGNNPKYLVPKGFADYFDNSEYQITEMDWFSKVTLEQTNIHFLPAHHFNSRIWVPYVYDDDNRALWGGWLVEEQGHTVFFAGDTGYSDHFKDIHKAFGAIDICLIPIASYHHEIHQKWYRYVHTRPEDAIAAADDLACKITIPWGYGNHSWQMGDLSSHSALFRLKHVLTQIPTTTQFYILNEGEEVNF